MDDTAECVLLLAAQKKLLKRLLADVEERMRQFDKKSELVSFLFMHGMNICEMTNAALLLVQTGEPFAIAPLARCALESAFNMIAGSSDVLFSAQKMAFELSEMADKIDFFTKRGCLNLSQKPIAADCRQRAKQLRDTCSVEYKEWKHIEQIAKAAGMSCYYDDDYRFLSLHVHANQAGLINTANGFLVRKGLLTLANTMYFASWTLKTRGDYNFELVELRERMETIMNSSGDPLFLGDFLKEKLSSQTKVDHFG